MGRNWPRALRLAGVASALALATLATLVVNHPTRAHGPLGFDVASPLGALALALGLLALRALARRGSVYALAALLLAAAAATNFFFYPPIPDGAFFLARYGHTPAAELWPASAVWHVIAFAGVAWSLALASKGGLPANGWRGAGEAVLLTLLIVVGAAALELFTQRLPRAGGPWPAAGWWLAAMIAIAAAAWPARRNIHARMTAVFLALLTLLAAATLALYRFA